MESVDSSPNYVRATSNFGAKKEISSGGSECDETIYVGSSTCASAVNGPYAPKIKSYGAKHNTSNKKTPESFEMSDDSTEASPNYLKATSSSKGKKTPYHGSPQHSHSSFDSVGNKKRCLQATPKGSSVRNVKILIKKASFKPKRTLMNHSRVSEDASVDRETYSSTLKGVKFPEPVGDYHHGGTESERSMRVCRYHHCSLHGHCHGDHNPVPAPKRLSYRRRWSLKKQRSIIPRTEPRLERKNSRDKRKSVKKSLIVQERAKDNITFSSSVKSEQEAELFYGYEDVQDLGTLEVAFGEMSFPERSYQDNLNIMRKYQDFGMRGHCLGCSCNNREQSGSSNLGDVYNNGMSYNGEADDSGTSSPTLLKAPNKLGSKEFNKDSQDTPITFSEVTGKEVVSSVSDNEVSNDSNPEGVGDSRVESNSPEDPEAEQKTQVKESDTNSSILGGKLHFADQRHISMWNLIHQHMSSNSAAESTNKPLEASNDGENPVDSDFPLGSKENLDSCRDLSGSDMGTANNDSESQEIEIRKLFAIKLVREAIEKILLPEVQDQTSDVLSVTSETTPRAELEEKNPSEAHNQANDPQSDAADKEEGSVPSKPTEEIHITDDASRPQTIKETGIKVVSKTEKKALKHWSNLKKWILLQRFIRELEKVRKFNPKKPQLLPLNPDPEAEKVNLRSQTVDGRKRAEEWMLDYALRQAVGQLAPTQKKKVALLVKAFETVVPPQEEPPQVQCKNLGISGKISIFESENQEIGTKLNENVADLNDSNDGSGKILNKFQSVVEDRIGDLKSTENSAVSSNIAPKEENPIEVAGVEIGSPGKYEDISATMKIDYPRDNLVPSDGNIQPEDEQEKIGREKRIKMWHMIYQHVAAGIAEKVGRRLLDDGADDYELEEENKSPAMNSFQNCRDVSKSSDLSNKFTNSDALKLVKEAVDEILLPEFQDDSSETRSVTSESTLDQEEEIDKKAETQESKTAELVKPKNWSKLKKLILLKRSIRVLEKARKPKMHVSAPIMPGPEEPEKIDLRRQMMDERKKAEQWMLDYAVQHIVGKLTPARKRRVSMLVEAFEAVVPLPEM